MLQGSRTSSSRDSSADSKPHNTFPFSINSSLHWVGLSFFIKLLRKLTGEWLFCLLLITCFSGIDFSEGCVKRCSQFLSNSERDRSNFKSTFLFEFEFWSLTESSCAHTPSPSVKSKIFLERSVLCLFEIYLISCWLLANVLDTSTFCWRSNGYILTIELHISQESV